MIRQIHHAYLADNARVVGEVELGRDASIWYGVSIRGDVAKVVIGEGTNVQDNAVIHCDHGFPNVIGNHVTIGHSAVCHGVEIGDWSLIGIGAIILGHAKIGKGCLVAAGTVVPPNCVVPDGMVIMGVPGKVTRSISEKEIEYTRMLPVRYMELAKLHASSPNDPRVKPWGA